ncbi:hypothetical protein LB505_002090 [Fusarium chuoi]|nr:hypothetical protein LB505_002090 [Fusarium chuoi]
MSMYSSGVKPGEIPPIYDEVMLARKGQEIRHASSSMPWWNPRYWRKRIWAAIIIVILVIVIIIVAVAVERARKNMYPDYSPLSYIISHLFRPALPFSKSTLLSAPTASLMRLRVAFLSESSPKRHTRTVSSSSTSSILPMAVAHGRPFGLLTVTTGQTMEKLM